MRRVQSVKRSAARPALHGRPQGGKSDEEGEAAYVAPEEDTSALDGLTSAFSGGLSALGLSWGVASKPEKT